MTKPPLPDVAKTRGQTPQSGRFEGILEGMRGHDARLRDAIHALHALGIVRFHTKFDGPRFTLLPDDEFLDGRKVDDAQMQRLIEALQEVVNSAADPARVESTLRCTRVFGDDVVETLFSPRAGEMQGVSRRRAKVTSDEPMRLRPRRGPLAGASRGHRVAVTAMLAVGVGVAAWQSGAVDLFTSPAAEEIRADGGMFHGLLDVAVEGSLAGYTVMLRRGRSYPETAAEVDAILGTATTTAERAAIKIAVEGGQIWVQMRDVEDSLLFTQRVGLRGLLDQKDGVVPLDLPRHAKVARVTLSLDSGVKPGRR